MATIYAHIGSEKCGSSLIELLFLNNQSMRDMLESQGIVSATQFHVALRKNVVGTQWDEGVHGRIKSQLLTPLRMSGKDVFISEELLLNLTHEKEKPNPLDLRIGFSKRLLQGFDQIKIILIVRRQDKFIESHYNQQVKRGETRAFEEVLENLTLDNYCWDVIADAWAEGFGKDNVTIIPFERSVLESAEGGAKNIVSAVCRVMGINVDIRTDDLPIVNPSLRPELLNAQREINATMDRATAEKVADILAMKVLKVPGAAQGLFSPEGRQHLLDRYAASNRRLFEKYIPQCSVDEYLTAAD
tara:strand:+ start:144 stop:1046 length:903 start_codon:yes stop_codon:yes gene_type:complete